MNNLIFFHSERFLCTPSEEAFIQEAAQNIVDSPVQVAFLVSAVTNIITGCVFGVLVGVPITLIDHFFMRKEEKWAYLTW